MNQGIDNILAKDITSITTDDLEEIKRLYGDLYESNAVKELVLDIITHDLKNPAGVISGVSAMLIDELPDNELVQLIKDTNDDLLNVIYNSTTLYKATSGEEIQKDELDLNTILKSVIKECKSPLNTAGMALEYDGKELPVYANPLIAEVFKNYISNAIKYASDGGKIVLETSQRDGYIQVAVRDFGETIPEENYEKIFQRRTQLENGKNKGRGLGLAIVKRIAEAHGGKVGVEPNKPTGNSFYLRLPEYNPKE
ncbi:HAMP domain-containing histidine kinase [Candidatus Woesearchaeota archaeon]|nr:HAMP domain-containing histidine kinase [Candidatus Woesearchaeota archaeon]